MSVSHTGRTPSAPGREPVVVVAVEHHGGVAIDAEAPGERGELVGAGDVAAHRLDEVGVPRDVLGIRDMPALEHARLHADLDDPEILGVEILLQPLGGDERAAVRRALLRGFGGRLLGRGRGGGQEDGGGDGEQEGGFAQHG